MTPEDVGRILAAAAGRDQRTVGTADVLAWYQDIGDLDPDDALAAVSRHYRESTDRLMPAHIRRIVAVIDRERARAAVLAQQEVARQLAAQADAARGPLTDRSAEIAEFVQQVHGVLPPGDPAKLRGPAWRNGQPVHRHLRALPAALTDQAS